MTLIELYDKSPLNNIIGVLSLKPDKVVFVGPSHRIFDDTDHIREWLEKKSLKTKVEAHFVNLSDPDHVRRTLTEIIEDERDCVFETTGGDDQVLMVASDLIEQYHLQSQRTDILSGKVVDTDGDGIVVPTDFPILSVDDLVLLHGGAVSKDTPPECTEKETDMLWEMTCEHAYLWNERLNLLALYEKNHYNDETNEVFIPSKRIPQEKYNKLISALEEMQSKKIICKLFTVQGDDGHIRYTYTKPYYHTMFTKAGNILEHKVLYALQNAKYAGGSLFNDCRMGAFIQWDDDLPVSPASPHNEIDAIAVRGVQPLFISCKGGDVTDSELYKFFTVSYLFGGEYVRKMLIITDIDMLPDTTQKRIRRRAEALDIQLVESAKDLTDRDWEQLFRNVMGLK